MSQSSAHKMWLRDFLPNYIPQIRTLIFGYGAALKNSTSTTSIGDYVLQLLLTYIVSGLTAREYVIGSFLI